MVTPRLDEEEEEQMDYTIMHVFLFIFALIGIYILTGKPKSCKLPPGPYPFPIIGSIHKLGSHPHQSFANLSKTYGPIMSLKLGSTTTIVISSPKLAKEVMTTHDVTLAGRTSPDTLFALDHHLDAFVFQSAWNKWRDLRKLSKEHIFAAQKLNASQGMRDKVVQGLVDHVEACCARGAAVEIGSAAFTTSLNILSTFFFSKSLARYDSNSARDFKDVVWDVLVVIGTPNLADFFPILKMADPQGLLRKATKAVGTLLEIFDKIILQRLKEKASSMKDSDDVLDSLLTLCEKNEYEMNHHRLKHLLLDLFVAGNDTTSTTVEWAMTELLHNPEKMAKAQAELKEVIGKGGRFEESDITRLPYLQAIIKETLRLHPPGPLLVPRRAEKDVEIEGFLVPKDAQILVNIWATARDASVWDKPESFTPERFLDSTDEIDFRGKHYQLIPFGAGRRICPGLTLGHKMVYLMLGSLLQSFEWKLQGDMKAEDIDMSEKFSLGLMKAVPLKALPLKFFST